MSVHNSSSSALTAPSLRAVLACVMLSGLLALLPIQSRAALPDSVSEGDIITLPLRVLIPTQPSVSYDQIYYKLGRFERDRHKNFDEICENNGARAVSTIHRQSELNDLSSFECAEAPGSRPNEMKTIVIGPDNKPYLTDGHHTFNVFWHMPGGGPELNVFVRVDGDYRDAASMDAFWQQMKADGNVWLRDDHGNEITVEQLPPSLGMSHFNNDPYRGLMYFSRGVSWQKPERLTNPDTGERYAAIPFLEFYWTQEIRQHVDVNDFDLTQRRGYNAAIRKVSDVILGLDSDHIIGDSGRTARHMGQFGRFNSAELERLNRPDRGKLSYMLMYKSAL